PYLIAGSFIAFGIASKHASAAYFAAVVVFALTLWLVAWIAGRLSEDHRRRLFVVFSITGNLGLLGVFKYCDFFGDSLAALARSAGFEIGYVTQHIVLPVGISFYTFQTMSYTIDVYRRKLEPTRDLLNFAAFVAFFPQLVAGPIMRAS